MLKKIVICFLLVLSFCACDNTKGEIILESELAVDTFTTENSKDEIAVFVCGQVCHAGLYYIPSGSRVQDAIDAAGGLSEEASLETINPASYVNDGDKIYVPSKAEVISEKYAIEEADDGRININTASKEELMTLPGIGESKADSIIEYRNEHGGYNSIEEIKNITGIKDGVFQKIKDLIHV